MSGERNLASCSEAENVFFFSYILSRKAFLFPRDFCCQTTSKGTLHRNEGAFEDILRVIVSILEMHAK